MVGFLSSLAAEDYRPEWLGAFHQGLSETGYVEGRTVTIEHRWADAQNDRLPALAADLVSRGVAVIVAFGTPEAYAAKRSTTTIPIVFGVGIDPVEAGLVASLNRPGGNVTGAVSLGAELVPKRLELLHEAVPSADIAALVNPLFPKAELLSKDLQQTAGILGVQLHILHVSSEQQLAEVFATVEQLRAGLVVTPDPMFTIQFKQLAALALLHKVPSIHFHDFAAAGGLMGYGENLTDAFHLGGVYTGRILKGEKPADLPVQLLTKFELVINLKTAKALGLTVPPSLLVRADEVIE